MVKLKVNEKEFELEKGEAIKESCKKAGVPFGCEDGQCGTCLIEIKKGNENLSELNESERDLGLSENENLRLACQCKINGKGDVECEGYI